MMLVFVSEIFNGTEIFVCTSEIDFYSIFNIAVKNNFAVVKNYASIAKFKISGPIVLNIVARSRIFPIHFF